LRHVFTVALLGREDGVELDELDRAVLGAAAAGRVDRLEHLLVRERCETRADLGKQLEGTELHGVGHHVKDVPVLADGALGSGAAIR